MRKHVRVVLAYTLLALALTWPMIARITTHVPGDGIDDPSLAWNLWWVKHSLVDQPQNPFASAWQFWPIGINLAFYTLTILNGLLSVPLQGAFGLIPAYNLLLLSSFVLSGLGAYLLGLELLAEDRLRRNAHLAAFVGGALYAFASAKLFYAALGQGNIASSQWVPFAALYILRAARPDGRPRDAALAGLFLVMQAYAELTYASFLLVFVGLAAAWRLGASLRSRAGGQTAGGIVLRFVLIAVLFTAGIAPVLANMLPDLRAEGDFFTSGGGFADVFSADLAGYTVPTQLHPLLGGIVKDWSAAAGFPVNKGQQIYAGYVALALAAIGLWQRRRRGDAWFWAASASLFFLLTLGPTLRIAGADTGLPLPFRIFEQLPFFKGNRYPSRYSVMLLVSLAPLVAGGMASLLEWMGRRREPAQHGRPHIAAATVTATALVLALLLFEHLSAPLPAFDLRAPELYGRVRTEDGDFAVLELPPGWRNGARVAGKQDVVIMQQLWNETSHGKRVLGGNTSRNPEYKFQYFSEQPTLARLIALTNASDVPQHDALRAALAATPVTEEDRRIAGDWAAFTNIRYVMVHRDKLPAETEEAARLLLPLSLVAEEGDLALYAVTDLPRPRSFELNSDAGRIALGEGWSSPQGGDGRGADGQLRPVFAQRAEVKLLLPLDTQASALRMRAAALTAGQEVSLFVDGHALGAQPLSTEPQILEWEIPEEPGRQPLSDVRLRFSKQTPVAEMSPEVREEAPAILVRSAGQEAGDFAHIYVDGVERSPNSRGYNFVVIDPGSGAVLDTASFDTHGDSAATQRMAEWLDALPDAVIVAGAVRDEASMRLGEEAVTALGRLGVTADLRGHFRWGHAFITTKGEGAAEALQGSDAVRPVQVSRGAPLSSPEAAAAVYSVELAP